jgi:tetratricopeptide (TPR) repeat protein
MSNNRDSLSKQDLINHFRHVYDGQPELATIDEYERDYSSENAIQWYTRNTFLYRVLNQALRNSDFDTLFALRFFIADLYKQLTDEHDRFRTDYASNSENSSVLKVYRGQSISNEELILLRQSQNGFFSMQSFLSASMTSTIGQFFAESSAQPTDKLARIVYEFNIDTRLTNTKPFAKINHLSYFQGEDEVLLALGSIFRINSVQFDDINQRWQAELTLCDDENFDLYDLMKQYAAEIVSDRVSPGFLLYQLGNYVKANAYFQKILNDRHVTTSEKAHCYRGLGTVAAEQHDFNEAYKNFEREFELWNRLGDEENVMEACKNIGNMLFYKGEYKEALEYLQTTAMYFKLNDNVMECARIYGMIAHIMGVRQRWDDCLMCYSEQLEVRQRVLDPNHEDIGITHANLGVTYHYMGKYKEAVNHFQKALDIYSHSLQSDHPNVLKAKENLHNSTLLLSQQ